MTVTATVKLREIAEESGSDPVGAVLHAVGDVSGYHPAYKLLLVGPYVRPSVTKGGIYKVDSVVDEDRYQNKVGLVLVVGPGCFVDDEFRKYWGFSVKAGDWVYYRGSDTDEMFFVDENGRDGAPCRSVEDIHIKAKVDDPSRLY